MLFGSRSQGGGRREMHTGFCGETWRKTFVRPTGRWVDNIKMDVREIRWGTVGWNYIADDRDWWRDVENWYCNFGLREVRGLSRPAARLSAYKALCSLEFSLVIQMATVVFTAPYRTVGHTVLLFGRHRQPVTWLSCRQISALTGGHQFWQWCDRTHQQYYFWSLYIGTAYTSQALQLTAAWFILVSTSSPQHELYLTQSQQHRRFCTLQGPHESHVSCSAHTLLKY
jgi:hypothetical protein